MASRNIVELNNRPGDKSRHFSGPIMILLVVVAYVVIVAVNYFSKDPIRIYEVNETSIADDSTLTGFILRDETVITSKDNGYINFYHADQSKVGKSEVIYTLDQNGSVSNLLKDVASNNETTKNDIAHMREIIQDYYVNYNPATYYQVQDFHYNIENTIFEQSRDNLYSDLKEQLSGENISGDFIKAKAKYSGIISYSIDGYEESTLDSVSTELFQKANSVQRKQLYSSEQVEKDAPICKLVTNEEWKIIVPLSDTLYEKIKDSTTIRVTVKKDNVSFNTELAFHTKGDAMFAVLSTSRFMGRYLNDRFLSIELNLNAATGFKIPNSSIIQRDMIIIPEQYVAVKDDEPTVVKIIYKEDGSLDKETVSLADAAKSDGKYYVNSTLLPQGSTISNPQNGDPVVLLDISSELGVYCVNTGYCKFRKIEKIYENNEYTIVSQETKGGISNFDHIVSNPETITENDFIQ